MSYNEAEIHQIELNPAQVSSALDAVIQQSLAGQNGICLFLEGPPGGGKSSLVQQAATRHGIDFVDLRLVQLDPVDLRGIPTVSDGKTVWAAPDFLPSDPDWKGVLFLDELPQAVPLVQNTVSQLVLDRRMGEYVLPEGAIIVAAGNPRSSKAATNEIPRHLANRFVFIKVRTSAEVWLNWAAGAGVRPEVTSFFRLHDNLLHAFEASQQCNPTPRSWAYVSKILDLPVDDTVRSSLIAGAVGEGAGKVFEGHLRLWEQVPDIDLVLADPENAPVPHGENAPGITYALASKLSRMIDAKNAEAAVTYLKRLPTEYGVVCMNEATKVNEKLIMIKAVRQWFAEHHGLIVG